MKERPVGLVRGTRDWLPDDYARLAELESTLLRSFGEAGFRRMRIPVLEQTELHERKSGAGVVRKLYELADGHQMRACLRPELTAGIVRAYCEASETPKLPWRVCVSGPVFRHEPMRPGYDREFLQVGVEMLGASGAEADGEVIRLAWQTLQSLGVTNATLRIGHVGLILEMLGRSGLPEAARAALVERLSEDAAEGRGVGALESALDQLADWLSLETGEQPPRASRGPTRPWTGFSARWSPKSLGVARWRRFCGDFGINGNSRTRSRMCLRDCVNVSIILLSCGAPPRRSLAGSRPIMRA